MTCTEWQERFLDGLTEPQSAEGRAALDQHLGKCADCARWAPGMGALWSELGGLAEPIAPTTLRTAVLARSRPQIHRRRTLQFLAWAAALFLVFWTGWTMKPTAADAPPSPAPSGQAAQSWLLLLREPIGAPLVETGSAAEQSVVQEYSAWAGGLAREGRLVSAEKLADPVTWLPGPGSAESTTVTGFFLIHAESAAEAERIARASPHLRRGGTIELRRIEPT